MKRRTLVTCVKRRITSASPIDPSAEMYKYHDALEEVLKYRGTELMVTVEGDRNLATYFHNSSALTMQYSYFFTQ